MRKEDIKVGDLLRTREPPPNSTPSAIGPGLGIYPERLVLVVSLDDNRLSRLTVLDCGVRTSISSIWLKPL